MRRCLCGNGTEPPAPETSGSRCASLPFLFSRRAPRWAVAPLLEARPGRPAPAESAEARNIPRTSEIAMASAEGTLGCVKPLVVAEAGGRQQLDAAEWSAVTPPSPSIPRLEHLTSCPAGRHFAAQRAFAAVRSIGAAPSRASRCARDRQPRRIRLASAAPAPACPSQGPARPACPSQDPARRWASHPLRSARSCPAVASLRCPDSPARPHPPLPARPVPDCPAISSLRHSLRPARPAVAPLRCPLSLRPNPFAPSLPVPGSPEARRRRNQATKLLL